MPGVKERIIACEMSNSGLRAPIPIVTIGHGVSGCFPARAGYAPFSARTLGWSPTSALKDPLLVIVPLQLLSIQMAVQAFLGQE
jgi:hypothetical protein